MPHTEEIKSLLFDFEDSITGQVQGVLVASGDGFLIADTLPEEDGEEVAAMVATTMGVSRRMSAVLGAGEVTETGIQGTDRQIFLYRAGETAVLAVVAAEEANVGMISLKAREAAERVADQLRRSRSST